VIRDRLGLRPSNPNARQLPAEEKPPALVCTGLTKRYGSNVVLRGVDLTASE
jgi:hypothetical protein